MVSRQQLTTYLNQLLTPEIYQDYTVNGLQIEGKNEINKIVSGVTASQDLIEVAIKANADAILVHHGYFWTGENPAICGMKKNRIQALLQHQINLFAYHLPLDGHAQLGNNVQLAQLLEFDISDEMPNDHGKNIGLYGRLKTPMSPVELSQHIAEKLQRQPQYIAARSKQIGTIAWCTGGADKLITDAIKLGVDAYLSGEISEPTVHTVRECNIHYFACGHHATERYGVKALGEHLAQQFNIDCEFIDIDNPV